MDRCDYCTKVQYLPGNNARIYVLLLDETREDGLQASAHVWTSRRRRLDLTRRENPVDAGLIRMKKSIVGASRAPVAALALLCLLGLTAQARAAADPLP